MKARYARAMEWLYVGCIVVSGASLVFITLIIPYGVLMRYGLNAAASWPEPLSVLLMILFSFLGGAAVYRAQVHMAVRVLVDGVGARARRVLTRLVDVAMLGTAVFMVVWGLKLVATTWNQVIAEFPWLSVGLTYLPLPLGGLITVLFILERLWVGDPPPTSLMYRDDPQGAE